MLRTQTKHLDISSKIFNDLTLLQIFLLLKPFKPMLVGGCVRDALLGEQPKDFDIVIPKSSDFAEVTLELESNGWKCKEAGLRFNVLHVSKNDENFEIAAYRKDVYAEGGVICMGSPIRAVNIEDGDINTDAHRRDFTVNALYYDPFSGSVLDPTGRGLDDIRTKTLRFVGKASERLKEDPMRAFRFYRFIHKGFTPSPKCLRAVRQYFPECVKKLSELGAEGIRNEIERIVL